jgi:hypothetical protein
MPIVARSGGSSTMSQSMSQSMPSESYLQIARTLPRPSPTQCDRFLQHVAVAQRWVQLLLIDGGVPCVVFLNPQAGQQPMRDDAGRVAFRDADRSVEQYRGAFGHLDYATPLVRSPSGLIGGDLGLPQRDDYAIPDAAGRAVALPAELLALATCSLNATIHPNMALLLEMLTQSNAPPLRPSAAPARLQTDGELRAFIAEYVREELAGFQCPDDQAAWEMRQLQAFQQLYAPRHAEQIARLRCVLNAMVSWVYDR